MPHWLLKKPSLDPTVLLYFWSVSNFPSWERLLRKCLGCSFWLPGSLPISFQILAQSHNGIDYTYRGWRRWRLLSRSKDFPPLVLNELCCPRQVCSLRALLHSWLLFEDMWQPWLKSILCIIPGSGGPINSHSYLFIFFPLDYCNMRYTELSLDLLEATANSESTRGG